MEKLRRIKADPQKVSIGYALGVFLGTTPFIGLKVFIALLFTSVFKWNKIASVIGVYHINILTAPLFYGFSFLVGKTILGEEITFVYPEHMNIVSVFSFFYGNAMIFNSLLLGGMALGIPMGFCAYLFARSILRKGRTMNPNSVLPLKEIPSLEEAPSSLIVFPRAPVYTVITGASSGLGREFAIECARQGMNLILVALPGRNLDLLCRSLELDYHIEANYYETDLTDIREVYRLGTTINETYRVNWLINNAGTGGTIPFDESSVEYLERIIQLNITAVSVLTRLLIPELKSHPKAYILNVSSMAAFSPIPFKTVYPASKAFIYNFSRSLNQELKPTSVKVGVVHPGPILTNPDVIVRIVKQGSAGKIGLLSAHEIARLAISGLRLGKHVIVPGLMNKMNRFLMWAIPAEIRLPFLSRVIAREIIEDNRVAA